MQLLSELHDQGATICMVTHDARYEALAQRTVRLFDGLLSEDAVTSVRAPISANAPTELPPI
jgi:putative ABC transport system ATP-binding protein